MSSSDQENDTKIVNELLTYMSYYMNSKILINITKIANNFYSNEEILEAKKLLWSLFANVLGPLIERRDSDKRSCSEANLGDISEALIKLDSEQKFPIFVAKNLDKIPDRQPDDLNILFLVERISKLEKKISDHEDNLSQYGIDILKMKDDIHNSTNNEVSNVNIEMIKKLIIDEITVKISHHLFQTVKSWYFNRLNMTVNRFE